MTVRAFLSLGSGFGKAFAVAAPPRGALFGDQPAAADEGFARGESLGTKVVVGGDGEAVTTAERFDARGFDLFIADPM